MTDQNLPSIEYLHKRLRYESTTGRLWRNCADMPPKWNGRWADSEAFMTTNSRGYRQGSLGRRKFTAHRVIWALHHGAWPYGQFDHIDHDCVNNRIENLRQVTHMENMRNAAISCNNTSGFTGVCWVKSRGSWQAQIKVNRKTLHLGYFSDINEAVAARKKRTR